MSDLNELLERCKAATGPSRGLDVELAYLWPDINRPFNACVETLRNAKPACPPFTGSVDAILMLIGVTFPGWKHGYGVYHDGFKAHVTVNSPLRPMPNIGEAKTIPLAFCCAFLSAMIARAALKDGGQG